MGAVSDLIVVVRKELQDDKLQDTFWDGVAAPWGRPAMKNDGCGFWSYRCCGEGDARRQAVQDTFWDGVRSLWGRPDSQNRQFPGRPRAST